MTRSRLVNVVAVVALVAVLMVLAASAQERRERQIRGAVVSIDLEKVSLTVRLVETGEVLVINAGWTEAEGKEVRNPQQVALIGALKPGDQIAASIWFGLDREVWIIREISKVGAAAPTNIGEQVKAMDARLVAMEKKLDNIEAMLKQLLAK